MNFPTLLTALLAAAAHIASARIAPVFIQPLTSPETPPALLAEIAVPDQLTSTPSDSSQEEIATFLLSYEAPDLPEGEGGARGGLVRIGVYDAAAKRWVGSTSVASADNFGRGYSPHFALSVDGVGNYLGVACRGVRVDAGQTRDFGPQAVVVRTREGPQPALGKPVVLSPEGKKVVPEERSFLQKYWWALAIGAFLLLSGGGDDK
ncbi:hypothetical protein VTK56DRAFT_7074 [Thermocarpiscus australiensis]